MTLYVALLQDSSSRLQLILNVVHGCGAEPPRPSSSNLCSDRTQGRTLNQHSDPGSMHSLVAMCKLSCYDCMDIYWLHALF